MSNRVTVTPDQYTIIKALFNCVANKADSRSSLKHVYYNPKAKELVATDGTILRVEPMDLGKDPIYFAADDFKRAVGKNDEIVLNEYDETSPYADYDRVLPDREYLAYEGAVPYVGFAFDVIAKLSTSMLGKKTFILIPTGKDKGFKAFDQDLEGKEVRHRFLGLVMPIRVIDEPREIDNLLD